MPTVQSGCVSCWYGWERGDDASMLNDVVMVALVQRSRKSTTAAKSNVIDVIHGSTWRA